ncbi:MAG: nuclear transport factor 2 family protein [Ferruginibacter sp.]
MDKTIITSMLLILAFTSIAQDNKIEGLIKDLDQKNAYIVAHADTTALMKLLAPEFTINRSTGTVVSGRDKTLELMRHGMVSYDSFSVETEMVLVKGPALAISMGSEVVVSSGNRELKGQIVRRRFTHVWIKENGEWKLFARHANNICTN